MGRGEINKRKENGAEGEKRSVPLERRLCQCYHGERLGQPCRAVWPPAARPCALAVRETAAQGERNCQIASRFEEINSPAEHAFLACRRILP